MPTSAFATPWPALIAWCLLYISDYAFTLTCARLYQKQAKIAFEGSYELNPLFQRDIDALRIVSSRFLFAMLSVFLTTGLLWVVTTESFPELFLFATGCAIGLQLAIHVRHIRNFFLFRAVNRDEVHGRIEYPRTLLLTASAAEFLAFSALFLVLFAFTRSWFVLGGAAGCFLTAVKHRVLAGRRRSSAVAVTQTQQ